MLLAIKRALLYRRDELDRGVGCFTNPDLPTIRPVTAFDQPAGDRMLGTTVDQLVAITAA